MHYDTTVLYCVVYFYLHFFPYPRKLNDNEKLWIYSSLNIEIRTPCASAYQCLNHTVFLPSS